MSETTPSVPPSSELPNSTSDHIAKCATCQSPASKSCSGCKDVPGSVNRFDRTYYCNAECQKANWSTHKKLCKGLRLRIPLYRAGEILQWVFYTYRKIFFDRPIDKIEMKDGDTMYIHDGDYGGIVSELHAIRTFPSSLLPNLKDQQALMVHMCCDDAVAWMHDLIKIFLNDIAAEVTERRLKFKNPKRQMVSVDCKGGELHHKDLDHHIIKVVLKYGGGEFALDLTGAQYGYYDPIIPWKEYCESRVSKFVQPPGGIAAFGSTKSAISSRAYYPGFEGAIVRLNMHVANGIKQMIDAGWGQGKVFDPVAILKMPLFESVALVFALMRDLFDQAKQHFQDAMDEMHPSQIRTVNVIEEYAKLGIRPHGA